MNDDCAFCNIEFYKLRCTRFQDRKNPAIMSSIANTEPFLMYFLCSFYFKISIFSFVTDKNKPKTNDKMKYIKKAKPIKDKISFHNHMFAIKCDQCLSMRIGCMSSSTDIHICITIYSTKEKYIPNKI